MQVIQFDHYGDVDVLYRAEVATPAPGPGAVRVRVAAAAVNPADVKWRQGMFKDFAPIGFPHVLGYDIAGTVDAVGPEVSGLKPGDRVFAMLDAFTKGGYAEYAVVPAGDVALIPEGLDFATAAALPTAALTGVQLIEDHLRPTPGQTVLITGAAGAVGRFAIAAARKLGARVVAAVRRTQAEEARALGADEVIALGEAEWTGAPFDHVADTVGGPAVAALCRHLAPGGLIRTVATTPIDPAGLSTEPVFIGVQRDAKKLAEIGRLVAAGEVPAPVAKRLPLAEAAQAHRLVEAGGNAGKIILEP